MRFALVTTAALVLALAGCKKPAPEIEPSEVGNSLTEVPADNFAPPVVVAPPVAPPVAANTATATPPPAPPVERTVREEQQIEEDADASGMTARLPADDDTQPTDQSAESQERE